EIAQLEQGSITLEVEGQACEIERADVEIISEDMPGWSVANEGSLTVALDINITDELRNEGVAREIVKRIQAHRKESGFEITDRINVTLSQHEVIEKAVGDYRDFICNQVLADSLTIAETVDSTTSFDFEEFAVQVLIAKV
ncbi:MAG: isoleucine--tRNA ligase, partial [Bacteroidaceae bacterium]|nr:isoleucine--tRNA ligase [Bacteroidaceae bacterium]